MDAVEVEFYFRKEKRQVLPEERERERERGNGKKKEKKKGEGDRKWNARERGAFVCLFLFVWISNKI